ncbi:MAG: hypothetical protein NT180_05175 [Actinobacteria bacterium]|nr:hypothetical protein [Actinomycetota bacterium]
MKVARRIGTLGALAALTFAPIASIAVAPSAVAAGSAPIALVENASLSHASPFAVAFSARAAASILTLSAPSTAYSGKTVTITATLRPAKKAVSIGLYNGVTRIALAVTNGNGLAKFSVTLSRTATLFARTLVGTRVVSASRMVKIWVPSVITPEFDNGDLIDCTVDSVTATVDPKGALRTVTLQSRPSPSSTWQVVDTALTNSSGVVSLDLENLWSRFESDMSDTKSVMLRFSIAASVSAVALAATVDRAIALNLCNDPWASIEFTNAPSSGWEDATLSFSWRISGGNPDQWVDEDATVSLSTCDNDLYYCDSSDTSGSEWITRATRLVYGLGSGSFTWTPYVYGDYDVVIEIWDDGTRLDYEVENVQVS